jgi:hypothetical protein
MHDATVRTAAITTHAHAGIITLMHAQPRRWAA